MKDRQLIILCAINCHVCALNISSCMSVFVIVPLSPGMLEKGAEGSNRPLPLI